MQTAASLGANAVLGVDIDYEGSWRGPMPPGIEHRNRGHRRVTQYRTGASGQIRAFTDLMQTRSQPRGDYEVIIWRGSMLLVSSTGTAVTVEPGTGADAVLHAWRDCPDTKLCATDRHRAERQASGAEQEPRPSSRKLPGMILTATSRIEEVAILQHHDLVTGDAHRRRQRP